MKSLLARTLRKLFRRRNLGRWRLPFEYSVHVLAGEREPELKHLSQICPGSGVAVDVGANLGYYTFKMAKRFKHVYSFEPNPNASFPIRTSGFHNVTLIDLALSDTHGSAELKIPVIGKVVLAGWASLIPGNCPGADHHLVRQVELATLDEFELADVALIKIDVEGHELEVLRGARQTISASRPILIVEIKNDQVDQVSNLLVSYGYVRVPLQLIAGVAGSPENHIFRHQSPFEAACAG